MKDLFDVVDRLNEQWLEMEKRLLGYYKLPIETEGFSIRIVKERRRLCWGEKPVCELPYARRIALVDDLPAFFRLLEQQVEVKIEEAKRAVAVMDEFLRIPVQE